jgi:RsiW-degrading membrane proteinase PrsW (M82 family)
MQTAYVFIALTGGLVPALFWLWFWLREDRAHPEPKALVISSFVAGMIVVSLVLPLQQFAMERFFGDDLILVWVIIEEILKYSAALIVVLWNKAVDEPIDAIIYMITIALGFSALENAFFIFYPLSSGDFAGSVLTGEFRFLGATLLHVLASGTVGAMMAFAFYKGALARILSATLGLCIAIVLHALFNFSIMNAHGETLLSIFMFVWLGIIVLFLIFEKVKRIQQPILYK